MKMTRCTFFPLLCFFILAACGKDEPPTEEILRPVRSLLIEKKSSAEKSRSFSGVSVSATETKLSFRVGGSLQALKVKTGQKVQAGKLIAALDSRDLQLKYEEAKAAVLNAQVQENSAKSNLARVRELYENNNIALSEYEQAKNSYAAAVADYSARLKQRDLQKRQLQFSRLSAPMAGVITQVPVALNENVNAGELVAILSASNEVEIRVGVPEAYISTIRVGDEVTVLFSALTDKPFVGIVTEVSYAAAEYSTFPVTVRLNQPDARLRPGMAADVAFSFQAVDSSSVKVPASAVAEDQEGNFVFLVKSTGQAGVAIVERHPVVIGELTQQGFVIQEGLQVGDAVVTSGVSKITNGMRVRFDQAASSK